MKILLLSMPDSFEHMPTVAIRMPNGALTSLAGNIDPHHKVAVADLILVPKRVRETVTQLVHSLNPDLVGLSVMTFQRKTALKIVALIRSLKPDVHIVVGGYDASLAVDAYTHQDSGVDFVVRGEGEFTFSSLLRALENGSSLTAIDGLSFRRGTEVVHNPDRHVSRLDRDEIRPPNRAARVLEGYTLIGRQVDVIETSRGCTFDCSFCSIIEMRGRNFFTYSLDRVIADIQDAQSHGAQAIFIIDDNITLDVHRFEAFCQAIVKAGLNKLDYTVQAMTSAIANHGETLAPLMHKAGFRYVFLGIENILEDDLKFLRAKSKNEEREHGHIVGNATLKAIEHIHRNKMYVVGGLIVGNPDDTPESIQVNLDFAKRYIDWPYIQHPTPYPRTPMTKEFQERGLIINERLEEYDGTTAVVRSEHLSAEEIEFMRWRAERKMKTKHMPAALFHSPGFVLRNAAKMLGHTYRGNTWKSLLGMEGERQVFERYRTLRRAERVYI
jgi:anaerobic magnesium-protoporphyrin IX monomethyl ester cyclase